MCTEVTGKRLISCISIFISLSIEYKLDIKMAKKSTEKLTQNQQIELLDILAARFKKHAERHVNIKWIDVEQRLSGNPEKLFVLHRMELSGGEPDVIGQDSSTGEYLFVDCAKESPSGRRSVCYDRKALESRKAHKPGNTVIDMVAELGSELLTEEQYRLLQEFGEFDNKTSSWVMTPTSIRAKGGAIFCDRRYGQVFTYHNGADSYYGARGFRTILHV